LSGRIRFLEKCQYDPPYMAPIVAQIALGRFLRTSSLSIWFSQTLSSSSMNPEARACLYRRSRIPAVFVCMSYLETGLCKDRQRRPIKWASKGYMGCRDCADAPNRSQQGNLVEVQGRAAICFAEI
jgi:hypothetical protein